MAKTSDLDGVLSAVCSRFTISCLNPYQKKAIAEKATYSSICPLGMVNLLFIKLYLRCSIASPLVQVT